MEYVIPDSSVTRHFERLLNVHLINNGGSADPRLPKHMSIDSRFYVIEIRVHGSLDRHRKSISTILTRDKEILTANLTINK